ncbi:2094_t:CDS:10 [Paraglomus occultum]|uniref:2094_t:CDS:1 n=1 Tax=Paraglomus occultum TaxID=144539 RepID=A0A9N9G495_9GLOM|nr:2094_t:CDS:10 [Paraglomus occultum]
MAEFFNSLPHEQWSLDGLAKWLEPKNLNKAKTLDFMKKAIQDIRDAPDYSEAAKHIYGTVGRPGVELLTWKKNNKQYLSLLGVRAKSVEEITKLKERHLQEQTTVVVNIHKEIASGLEQRIASGVEKEIASLKRNAEQTLENQDKRVNLGNDTPTPTPLDYDLDTPTTPTTLLDDDTDLEQDMEEPSSDVIKLTTLSGTGIGRYQILFLAEHNIYHPHRKLFTNEEWITMESNWSKIETKITESLPEIDANIKLLLERYTKVIKDATTGVYIDLNIIEGNICNKSPFEEDHEYRFERDYPLRWVQLVYNALGEVENEDRKRQLDLSRCLEKRRTNLGSWCHDAILVMKVGSKHVQVAFGEVIGNAFKHDDKKWQDDKEKMLKAMQLALFNLRRLFPEGLEDLETYGLLVYKKEFFMYSMHWVDGIYLVDQFNGFAIPDTSRELDYLPVIIQAMIEFKNRVLKLHAHMERLYKTNTKFRRRSNIDNSIVFASPTKK